MRAFSEIYDLACMHKGGAALLESTLPKAKSAAEIESISDAEYLSLMSLRIFRAGLKHSLVDAKWPEFERVFSKFSPSACAMLSDEFIEACMADRSIIRHLGKVKTIRHNAQFILDIQEEYGGFGAYLNTKSSSDLVKLCLELKKRGAHLGGRSAAAFLRMAGYDTFLLTRDVVAVLILEGIVDCEPKAKRDLFKVQAAFDRWQEESGRSFCEISRTLSYVAI